MGGIVSEVELQQMCIRDRYLGDGVTLEQYFKKTAKWDVEKARFWAATAQGNVRKIHSGIVGTVVDRYKDIVLADLDAVDFGENMDILEERWNEIFEGSKLNDVIGDAIVGALSSGDGAFKITADECSPYPIVEFYDAEDVEYVYILSLIHIYLLITCAKNTQIHQFITALWFLFRSGEKQRKNLKIPHH